MQSPISVWRLTTDQVDQYRPGMDLGEPHITYQPESLIKPGSKNPPIPRTKGAQSISKAQYNNLRAQGLTDRAIAAAHDVSPTTLGRWKKEWA